MAETEAVGIEPKCGPDNGFSTPKTECNGASHHNQDHDIVNSYVFVPGADAVGSKDSTVESGKISDFEEVNGNVESVNGDTLEGLTGKTESSGKVKVEQVEDSDAAVDGELENSGLVSGLEENQGSGESVGSSSISSHIAGSGNADGEYGNQIEEGSEDVVGGVVDSELQDLTVGSTEDKVKFGGEDEVGDVDVSVKAEGEVNLSVEVVENGELEVIHPSPLGLDLESVLINKKEEAYVVDDIVQSESAEVSANADEEVKLLEEVIKTEELEVHPSTSLDVDMGSDPINGEEETDVVEGILESRDVSLNAEDEVKLLEEIIKTAELEAHSSTSLHVDLKSDPTHSEEEKDVVGGVVGSRDMSVNAGDEVRLPADHEVPKSVSLDMELDPIHCEEDMHVLDGVVDSELQDVIVKAEDETKLSGEVAEISELKMPSSSAVNSKEEIHVIEDIVECGSQDVNVNADDEVKPSVEVLDTAELEAPLSVSLDLELESNPTNTMEEIDVVEDVVELELQDVSLDAYGEVKIPRAVETSEYENPMSTSMKVYPENAVKLSREVVETAELEIPPSTSLDVDLESKSKNSQEEKDVGEDVVEGEFQDGCMKVHAEIPLSTSLDLNLGSKPKEGIDVVDDVVECDVVETAEHEIPPSAPLDLDLLAKSPTKEETDVVEDVTECEFKDVSLKVGVEREVVESAEHGVPKPTSLDLEMDSRPVNTNEEIGVTLEVVQCEEKTNVAGNVECESQDANLKVEDEEVVEIAEHEVPSSTSLDLTLESNSTSTKEEIGVVANFGECDLQDPNVQTEDDVKLSGEVVEIAEREVPSSAFDSSDVNKEDATNIELETEDVEDVVDQIDGAPGSSNENLPLGEIVDTGNSQGNNTSVAAPSGSNENTTDREEASIKTKIKPFNFLIRVPRFDDEGLREQIRLAKLNIDEKTKLRDAIQIQIQEKRASTQIHYIDYEHAKGESRSARKSVRSKRIEIDSLQSVINKAKNALSVDDIDSQMYNMEHMIQHETLQLKEEKQLIREIKQLKQLREQLSSNMGSQEEIKQALEQRGEAEERMKILRKELDVLKGKVLKAEATAVEAEKKYNDENKKVRELQAQFRASDEVRQAAYVQWTSFRKELSNKNQFFYKYKDDAAIANNLVYSRDTNALYHVCTNNVEIFMELWNTNEEFRKDYTKFNARSTVWRLGTLDGRSLGPDESPPVLPNYVDARANRNVPAPVKVDLASQFPALEPKQDKTTESDFKSMKKKVTEEKNQSETDKGFAISTQVIDLHTVSGEDITHEEPKKSREEIEAMKKAEEMERKEAESKLKEERRLEALAKASEARERKKKQAEKLQMRAELKTLKEAEQKEKEREKRLRKKERKKFGPTDISDNNGCEIGLSSETAVETTSKKVEVEDAASSKKPKKHWLFGKQSKTKSTIPPALRNRNKKKLQQWVWVGIAIAALSFVFWMDNIGLFSGFSYSYKRRSPFMT